MELVPNGHWRVAIVGGGQAGLSLSWYLRRRGIDHVVLERHRACHAWREERWESFSLVTPNWQCLLPGHPYDGDDPDGFMPRDEIVRYLESYVATVDPPLVEGVEVTSLRRDGRVFVLGTNAGRLTADQVVLAVGSYHRPIIPRIAERLPPDVAQVHSAVYRCPERMPAGAVLVVGSGQSGAQIAEDLHLAGRRVHLATGSAPRVARRYRGRDVVAWLDDLGYYDMPVTEHPQGEAVRHKPNHYVTGRDGGRDIDLRRFAREGMCLYGRLSAVDGTRVTFGDDLAANLDRADEVCEGIKDTIDKHIATAGLDVPAEPRPEKVWHPGPDHPREVDLREAGITSVVWATGFASDWSWVGLPIFDGRGYPAHDRGVTSERGLYVLGLPWLHTWGSARLSGVGRDAEHLADELMAHGARPRPHLVLDDLAFGS
ncbi:MAG TPA: MSMEG_0569 family flavin-dependent oxidoreductase [Mycobacteriales bacterium]|jgi:putative flavoprotein involved in K+ transport